MQIAGEDERLPIPSVLQSHLCWSIICLRACAPRSRLRRRRRGCLGPWLNMGLSAKTRSLPSSLPRSLPSSALATHNGPDPALVFKKVFRRSRQILGKNNSNNFPLIVNTAHLKALRLYVEPCHKLIHKGRSFASG
jgi:hypothetical protein